MVDSILAKEITSAGRCEYQCLGITFLVCNAAEYGQEGLARAVP